MIDTEAIVDSTKSVLDERFAGYVLIGFVAGCDDSVTIINNDRSELKRLALIAKLQEAEMRLAEDGPEED